MKFAEAGALVYATDINEELVRDLQGHHGAGEIRSSKLDAIEGFLESVPQIDILFNCAGWVHNGTIQDCSEEDWASSFDINVSSMFRMTKAALPKLLKSPCPCIIGMSSVASSLKAVPNRFVYSATKAAVIGLTKAIAADYVSKGLRVNCICPGTVDTPSLRGRINAYENPEAALQAFIARQPMKRLGTADEIADMALFLASSRAAYITGQSFVVDGGWSM
ncbi:unnamed protein product [Cyprideis torosa]|uniref:Dehydrogenase/reductase SDR family member 6 n=1 Tax=Cyprideis torosa TaxID=163714 RepID=A0A7R8WRJ1_9CRUS|nr:unnamed protein product [Cyprideis torosa]CAG0908392.1 unnamed protein product [Cyprideis torosa]